MKCCLLIVSLLNFTSFSEAQGFTGNEQNGRSLVTSASALFGQVQQVGSQWMQSVNERMGEAGKVARVLAGDASDAIKTVRYFSVQN